MSPNEFLDQKISSMTFLSIAVALLFCRVQDSLLKEFELVPLKRSWVYFFCSLYVLILFPIHVPEVEWKYKIFKVKKQALPVSYRKLLEKPWTGHASCGSVVTWSYLLFVPFQVTSSARVPTYTDTPPAFLPMLWLLYWRTSKRKWHTQTNASSPLSFLPLILQGSVILHSPPQAIPKNGTSD